MSVHQAKYEELAARLDKMPSGFPRDAERADLELLRWIFSPEEAAIALALPDKPANAATVAQSLGRPVEEVAEMLDRMAAHSQLLRKKDQELRYTLMPWVPGLQEGQFSRKDKTEAEKRVYVELWERYLPTYAKTASYGPAIHRIVPINMNIESEAKPHRIDDVRTMIDGAKSFYVLPCVCRQEKRIAGHGCNHLSQVCLMASAKENDDFDGFAVARQETGRIISRDEAHRILDQAEADGLIHQTWNADTQSTFFICNCCTCCCLLLRMTQEFKQPFSTVSNFFAAIDEDECTQCGACVDDTFCDSNAIKEDGGDYLVKQESCIGCGVCTVQCPSEAIHLHRKPEQAETLTYGEWARRRMAMRPQSL